MKLTAIVWKDLLLRFTDKMEMLFFLILPVIFTFLLGGWDASGDGKLPVAVSDQDGSQLAANLLAEIDSLANLSASQLSYEQAEEGFKNRDFVAWLNIPAGFEDAVLAGESGTLELNKLSNDTSGDVAERALRSAISVLARPLQVARFSLQEAEIIQPFASQDAREAYFSASFTSAKDIFQNVPQRLIVKRAAARLDAYDQRAQASIGQMVMWVFIPLLGISGLFVLERSGKTLQRLLTTPTAKSTFMLGTIGGQFLTAVAQMLILILFGIYVMNVFWGQSPLGLAVMITAFGLASVAFGTMLGTFVKTDRQANSLSITLGMTMGILGGCGWPIELFPPLMQQAAKLLPTYWAMQGFTDLVMRGEGALAVMPEAAVLLGFALVFFIIGLRRFRYE
jgi:ABC-2 type transport system permease protein